MKLLGNPAFLANLILAATASGADAPKATLQLSMLSKVKPNGLVLRDVTNKAMDDNGHIDRKKIDAGAWSRLRQSGRVLEECGESPATGNGIVSAAPGYRVQDEGIVGASSAAHVQRYLDANAAEFRMHATGLQKTGAGIVDALIRRDGRKLIQLSNSLDDLCENGHVVFRCLLQRTPK